MSELRSVSWPGWEIVGIIGRGSFGTVYRIQREVYGDLEEAALKVIVIPRSEDEVDYLRCSGLDDQSITQTFHQQVGDIAREYKLMAQMRDNPNIVHCDDFRDIQHDDGLGWDIYIKMELLTPLMKALDRVATEEQIIGLGKDLCNALVTCQAKNVIHRDIKPQNVFVSPSGQFKLGDFGIARTVERTTRATAGIGTYSYMAPEVEKNEPYGKSADIYSLGLLMYWLLNERRGPFMPLPPAVPKYGDEEKARNRRFDGEAIPAPKNGSDALKAIVLKACAYDPKERYQTAGEMLEALKMLADPATSTEENGKELSKLIPPLKEENDKKELAEVEETYRGCEDEKTDTTDEVVEKAVEETEPNEEKKVRKKWSPKQIGLLVVLLGLAMMIIGIWLFSQRRVTSVCAGYSNTMVVYADGTVRNYGAEKDYRNVTDWEDVVSVSMGSSHTVGLKADGTVVVNGLDIFGECGVIGWKDIIAISAYSAHTVGLKSDGTVVAVGKNSSGQCNVGNWQDIVAISATAELTVGLKSDGTVVVTNPNLSHYFDTEEWRDIVAISSGLNHVVGLRADGTAVSVVLSNNNDYGQSDVENWRGIIAISAGEYHTVGLKSDGTVVAVGKNWSGECNVSMLRNIVSISAGSCHTVGVMSNGKLVAVGSNFNGQCDFVDE